MSDIVVLGIFCGDVIFRADRLPEIGETVLGQSFTLGPGGKGSNQAVGIGKLGGDVTILARLADDDFGKLARQTWKDANVRSRVIVTEGNHTGSAFVFVNPNTGDNAIIVAPGAANELSVQDVEEARDLIGTAKIFVTQLEQPLDATRKALEIARKGGATTILNPAPAASLPDTLLSVCDIVTPNETEARALTGIEITDADSARAACAGLNARGAKTAIITMGESGVYVQGHGMIPARKFGTVVDTTGAGDAFNAGLATALSEGQSLEEAARFGCIVAGLSVRKQGAAPSMPTRAEIIDALSA